MIPMPDNPVTPRLPAGADMAGQYLTFNLGGDRFAVGILHVKEIVEYGKPTSVPLMPAYIHGVINLRGSVLPVIDLSLRLGRSASRIGRRSCIVVMEVDTDAGLQDIGVVVDSVNAVVDISAAEIEPPPSFGARIRNDFIAGMGRLEHGFVILLQLARVLAQEELAALGLPAPVALNN